MAGNNWPYGRAHEELPAILEGKSGKTANGLTRRNRNISTGNLWGKCFKSLLNI
jgi:hypothetical protein